MVIDAHIILASGSPRRAELLSQIGVGFDVHRVDIDESHRPPESPEQYVERLAMEKSEAALASLNKGHRPVLSADTSVVIDNVILGKPQDEADFFRMMQLLSGRKHEVLTAFAIASSVLGVTSEVSRSWVTFRDLTESDKNQYWASGEPLGKAGGYAIQGLAAQFVTRIEGSYSGIVGLPLALVSQHLQRHLSPAS